MNTEEFKEVMTVFFSKTTGKIRGVCQGDQPFSYFNDDAEDMKIILDKLVTDYNQKVLFNWHFYLVKDGEIVVNEEMLNQYSI